MPGPFQIKKKCYLVLEDPQTKKEIFIEFVLGYDDKWYVRSSWIKKNIVWLTYD